jgi:hypothetical protein
MFGSFGRCSNIVDQRFAPNQDWFLDLNRRSVKEKLFHRLNRSHP